MSRMKMARFQTFGIQMRKNKPLDESHKIDQTPGTKMAFLFIFRTNLLILCKITFVRLRKITSPQRKIAAIIYNRAITLRFTVICTSR
ncbi:hypothetical protein Hanom_Chr07g00604121 [Helianthus anomalus]